ncbi:hypothetical protein Pmani_002438 [Petrolisthes manimaculis]|uniref:Alpha-1,3-mannosyl-glycoprotein 2-beta-N-acetylglucosaminyltransferase n=1 Tax=Petrolisthes manimaculis TaxID=1843537 RepID=A0AAE1UQZ9_9EUCA|nr:hypothetical protein Pmani_002438 [Petrolisthes manimaculis]
MVVVTKENNNEELSHLWRNIIRKREYDPVNMEQYERRQGERARMVRVAVRLSGSRVQVYREEVVVYDRGGEVVTLSASAGRTHSGVHVVVFHESGLHVMMARHFLTYQPAEHAHLKQCLKAVQEGRLVVILGMPEWVRFLGQGAEDVLSELGSVWAARVASGEAWAWIGVKGVATLAEGVTTRSPAQFPASDLWLEAYVVKVIDVQRAPPAEPRCPWYVLPGLQRQSAFCERYEGYGDLCQCHQPFFPDRRKLQIRIPVTEIIPVVVVTADKPHHLYRLLRNLLSIAGGGQTEVLVAADGGGRETLALVQVLGVAAVVHQPQGLASNRTNANVRFALYTVFSHFPQADKAIVLEDDLLLSPDFFRFFHQVAPLLDLDPTITCINAFSRHSYPDTAWDPRVLLRARSYPMYGWMTTRAYALEVIPKWVSGNKDWDWWLTWEDLRRGRDVVFPEVSRTFHSGSAGVHVSGFEQEIYFNRMMYNQLPHVTLMPIDQMVRERYDNRLHEDLKVALTVMPRDRGLWNLTWLPPFPTPRPLAIYLYAINDSDQHHSFRIFLICLRTYDESIMDIYKGVMRLRWRQQLIYLVGCPASPYCVHNPRGQVVYKPTRSDLRRASEARDEWDSFLLQTNPRIARHPALPPSLTLDNLHIASNPKHSTSK